MLWSEIKKWANSNGVEVVKNGDKFIWRRTGVNELPSTINDKNKKVRLWDVLGVPAKTFKSRRAAIKAEEAAVGVIVWNHCDELSLAAKDIFNTITENKFVEHQENYCRDSVRFVHER